MESLGARIAQARRDAGLTQHALSLRTGIQVGALSRYENNKMVPGLQQIDTIAQACRVSIDWLVRGESEKATGTAG